MINNQRERSKRIELLSEALDEVRKEREAIRIVETREGTLPMVVEPIGQLRENVKWDSPLWLTKLKNFFSPSPFGSKL